MTRFLPAVGCFVMGLLLSGNLIAQVSKEFPPSFPPGFNPSRPGEVPPQPTETPEAPRQRTPKEAKEHAEKMYRNVIEPVLKRDCYGCHGDKKATVGLNLQTLKPDFTSASSGEWWQRVYERVRDREMPPRKPGAAEPPLDEAAYAQHRKFVEAIGDSVSDARRFRSEQSSTEFTLAPISGEDSATIRLRKQIRSNAVLEASTYQSMYAIGRIPLETVIDSEKRLRQAELSLATTAEQRIAILKQALDSARTMEDIVYTHYANSTVDLAQFARAKHLRLEAQLQLRLEYEKK